MQYDLHAHSNHSDGKLSPTELVNLAKSKGVDVLALTDHDTVSGISAAVIAAKTCGLLLIPGVEISAQWESREIHIVGLQVDAGNRILQRRLASQQMRRRKRAVAIGESLANIGITDAYEKTCVLAGSSTIGRGHFAQFLLSHGYARNYNEVFKNYLSPGKPGYVASAWVQSDEAIQWIHEAGGVAVLAHPTRYQLTSNQLAHLLSTFREQGGDGLEVVTARHDSGEIKRMARYARRYGFKASVGSDFHGEDMHPLGLGQLKLLPHGCIPIWSHWSDTQDEPDFSNTAG